jgi:hypothetical protein
MRMFLPEFKLSSSTLADWMAKREAQSRIIRAIPFPSSMQEQKLFPSVPTRLTEPSATV